MTKTIDEMVAVMIAARDGKSIQHLTLRTADGQPVIDGDWYDCKEETINWNWHCFDYHVKPEPMKVYVNEYKSGFGPFMWKKPTEVIAQDFVRTITFVEEIQ